MSNGVAVNQGEARRITERICILLDSVSGQMDRLARAVQDAYSKRVDQVLGYESWADYAAKEFGPHTQSLAAPIRRELVAKLTDTGLSTRAIAPTVGMKQPNVVRVQHGLEKTEVISPDITSEFEADSSDYSLAAPDYENEARLSPGISVDPRTGEIPDGPAPKTITGLDGKHYTVPEPKPSKPHRTPITDSFTHQTVKLNSLVDSFTRLIEDDRFDTNKQNIADANASDIKRAIDALSKVLDALNNK